MNNYNVMVRGIVQGRQTRTPPNRADRQAGARSIRWSERGNPKAEQVHLHVGQGHGHASAPRAWSSGRGFRRSSTTTPFRSATCSTWACSSRWASRRARPFKPDARQRAILEEAARIGDAMGRVMLFDGPDRFHQSLDSRFPARSGTGCSRSNPVQQTDTYGQIDERLHYTYGAIYTTPALGVMKAGPGGNYVQAFKDKDGNRFDGGKNYRLHVPANVPAAAFWSLTLYDTATRSMIQNPSNDSARSSPRQAQDQRATAPIDLYFGPPKRPRGHGEQLDRDRSRQRLLPDDALLHPEGRLVRRDVEAAGRRAARVGA